MMVIKQENFTKLSQLKVPKLILQYKYNPFLRFGYTVGYISHHKNSYLGHYKTSGPYLAHLLVSLDFQPLSRYRTIPIVPRISWAIQDPIIHLIP